MPKFHIVWAQPHKSPAVHVRTYPWPHACSPFSARVATRGEAHTDSHMARLAFGRLAGAHAFTVDVRLRGGGVRDERVLFCSGTLFPLIMISRIPYDVFSCC